MEKKSIFLLGENDLATPPNYSPDEKTYISRFKSVLMQDRDNRDQARGELDGMTYPQYFNNNEKLANTFIGQKINKTDVKYSSGTIRQKLWAFLSAVNKMNLSASIMAFDDKESMIQTLGNGMTDILRKTEELDMDEEKKMIRLYEMLKQGHVDVQEQWKKTFRIQKSLNTMFKGQVKDVKWQSELKQYLSMPSRDTLWGLSVYPGTMKKYFWHEQPHYFTVDVVSYQEAATMFQNWERWKHVPRNLVAQLGTVDQSGAFNPYWSITDVEKNQVEIIRYEDQDNNEFMISLNGVFMLPVGFPLSEITPDGCFSTTRQIFEIIHHKFPYGKSLPMKLRNKSAVYDEMTKNAVLLTQQKFAPTLVNQTGKHLSSKIWFPGKVISGINPDKLRVLNEKMTQGVGNGEIAMLEFFKQEMDDDSVSKQFQGQPSRRDQLATEILTVQEQSSMIIGQTIFVSALLEKKLADLRIPNLLKNWFEPIDTMLDSVRGIINKYRTTNIESQIPGKGMGRSIVVPTDVPPTEEEVKEEEDNSPIPIRKIYLVPAVLKMFKYTWLAVVNPTDKKSSNTNKLMFRAMMADAMSYFQQDLNIDYLEERFAETWQEDSSKLFMKQPAPVEQSMVDQAPEEGGGGAPTPGAPNLKMGGNEMRTL